MKCFSIGCSPQGGSPRVNSRGLSIVLCQMLLTQPGFEPGASGLQDWSTDHLTSTASQSKYDVSLNIAFVPFNCSTAVNKQLQCKHFHFFVIFELLSIKNNPKKSKIFRKLKSVKSIHNVKADLRFYLTIAGNSINALCLSTEGWQMEINSVWKIRTRSVRLMYIYVFALFFF